MVYIVRHFNEKDSIYNFCFKVSEHIFAYFYIFNFNSLINVYIYIRFY